MTEDQDASYSDEDYGSAGEDAYEQDEYEEENAQETSGIGPEQVEGRNFAGGALFGEVAVGASDPDDRDEANEYEGEDGFECDDRGGSIQLSGDDVLAGGLLSELPPRDVADATDSLFASKERPGSEINCPEDAPPPGDARKPLVPSRSFSVPSVPSESLAGAVDAAQRSASVPSVPAAAITRWYDHAGDGEVSPRSKQALVPLPVLEEAYPAGLCESDEDADSDSDSEENRGTCQSRGKPKVQDMARLRSLSLQHRQLMPTVLLVRRSKSHIYLARLPSVSELAAENISRLGLTADLVRYANTSDCGETETIGKTQHQEKAEIQEHGEVAAQEVSNENELLVESNVWNGRILDATLFDKADTGQNSRPDKDSRRESEQLLWEVQTLIKAQHNGQVKTSSDGSNTNSDDTQDSPLASVVEVDVHALPDREGTSDQYEDDGFSDEVEPTEDEDAEPYAGDEDDFSDDTSEMSKIGHAVQSLGSATTSTSESNGKIFLIAELEDDNRRETEDLLREAQILIQARRDDRDGGVEDIKNSSQQPPAMDQYGGDEEFDDDDAHSQEDDDPYLTDDNGEHEADYATPTEPKRATDNTGASVTTTEDASSTEESPAVQCYSDDKVGGDATELPNTQRNQDTNGMTSNLQNNSGTVTPEDCEAEHHDISSGGSTAVAAPIPTCGTQKCPRPPPVKPATSSKSDRRGTGVTQVITRPTPRRVTGGAERASHLSSKGSTDSPSRYGRPDRHDPNVKHTYGAKPESGLTAAEPIETKYLSSSSPSPSTGRASSPALPSRCSPPPKPKPLQPRDEYPELPRKDPVPKQRKAVKKPLSPELLRELKPVRSPPNLRIDTHIVDKAKRDWLFLNMFRHGQDVSKYEPFVPRSVLPRPPGNDSVARPQSASTSPHRIASMQRGGTPTAAYGFGGRKLHKPQDPRTIEREKSWVATKPLDCAIPAYDSILDKYCATVTSPIIQRHIYQTRYEDLSPQLAFVLEKRAEKHYKQVVRASGTSASYHSTSPIDQ